MNQNKRRIPAWLGLYTLMFLCCAAAMAAVLARCGRTLIWNPDGVKQPYTVMGYLGRALRDLFAGRGWRMLDYSLGQGMDVLVTCTYYGYTDPLTWLGALASGRGIEIAYMLTDGLRAYLAGAFLAVYARKAGAKEDWAVACAAMVYAFSGYFAWMYGRHPYFLNGALWLPILLWGVERVLSERRWLPFTLAAAAELVVNFYFAYMNTAIAVVYIIVRLIFRARERRLAGTARDGFTLLGGYLLGAALAAVVFVPVARVYLSNSRMGVQAGYTGSMLHFGAQWYRDMFMDAFSPWHSPGNYLFMNFAPPALFALLALCGMRGARPRQVRLAMALCLAAASIPLAGYVLNGGAYVSERWSYVMALFAALGCALGLPELWSMPMRRRTIIAAAGLAWALALGVLCLAAGQKKQLIAPLLIALFALALLASRFRLPAAMTASRARGLLAVFLTMCCAAYTLIGYLPRGYNYLSEQMKADVHRRVASQAAAQWIDDDGVWRANQSGFDDANAPMLGYMGTSFYWSLTDADNSAYYMDLALPGQYAAYHLNGLGGGAAANAVASVKYFVRHEGETEVVPYGFEFREELALPDGGAAEVYENAWALPLGYAFDARMSAAAWRARPVEERIAALTRCAIVTEAGAEAAEAVPELQPEASAVEVPFSIAEENGATLRGGRLAGEAHGRVRLSFEAPADSETYLILQGLRMVDLDRMADGQLTVTSARGSAASNVPHPRSNFYFGKENYAFCLGNGALEGCGIELENAGGYAVDDVRVVSLPLADYREQTQARRAEALENVQLGNDRLSGSIEVSGPRVLQIAVPYSDGWRAWVDGEDQPLFRCGGLYMGLALTTGSHVIELRYTTPGLKAGATISLGAVALIALLLVLGAVRRRGMKCRNCPMR